MRFREYDLERIDIKRTILSDDIEFLLNHQNDKIKLKKLTFHFDINRFVVAIDSEFLNCRTKKVYKTDHYKEAKQYEQSIEIPDHVYPISITITDDSIPPKRIDMKDEQNKDIAQREKEQEATRQDNKEEELKEDLRATMNWVIV